MLIYFLLLSGILLGWSLGANKFSNIFGTAINNRLISFKNASLISGIFVILGAVLQGSGTTKTISQLGSVDAVGGAFTIALCSAVVVMILTKYRRFVSTSQAIVGAIIGWCYFTSNPVNYTVLGKIVGVWLFGPILGAAFSAGFYLLLRKYMRTSKLHLIKMETIIRLSLLVFGALAAYCFGANNIANVMGVFVNSMSFSIAVGSMTIHSSFILLLVGGIAIALGIATYSKKVMQKMDSEVFSLTPETALVVVLSQSFVLFIFSSSTISNLFFNMGFPAIPLAPVSSTQVLIGSVFGIGLVKGIQDIQLKTIGNILLSWIITPLFSGVATFVSLFFVQRVFAIPVTNKNIAVVTQQALPNIKYEIPSESNSFLILLLMIILVAISIYFVIAHFRNKKTETENNRRWQEKIQFSEFQKALTDIEVNTVQLENTTLATRLDEKRNELVTYSLNIGEQRQYLNTIYKSIQEALDASETDKKNAILKNELIKLKQKMSFSGEVDKIYQQAEQFHNDFIEKLNNQFPDLSTQEKRLMVLLRIGLSSKEIAPLLNISMKSVEISRYRLRKKLNLNNKINLVEFTKTM
jgi:phosphate/sulfate permease/DNA-binding CsgD family transcriptional regulator